MKRTTISFIQLEEYIRKAFPTTVAPNTFPSLNPNARRWFCAEHKSKVSCRSATERRLHFASTTNVTTSPTLDPEAKMCELVYNCKWSDQDAGKIIVTRVSHIAWYGISGR